MDHRDSRICFEDIPRLSVPRYHCSYGIFPSCHYFHVSVLSLYSHRCDDSLSVIQRNSLGPKMLAIALAVPVALMFITVNPIL